MSAYETYQGHVGVKLAYIVSRAAKSQNMHPDSLRLITYSAYQKRAQRTPGLRLREGRGAGNEVLLSWTNLPTDWQTKLRKAFGDPTAERNPLEYYYQRDAKAAAYFSGATPDSFQYPDGSYPTPEQAERWTINASVLNALSQLKEDRETSCKMRGSTLRGLWPSLINDTTNFNDILKRTGEGHTLPTTIKLKNRLEKYLKKGGYITLVDGRAKNTNAQVVTPEMLEIWRDIYAGQRGYKPDYTEVSRRYDSFRIGIIDVIIADTGEVYDRTLPCFKPASRSTVYAHQSDWQHRAPTHARRSGDRQKFKTEFETYHKLIQPEWAGSIISIDDRQPPFKTLAGNRMWFYLGLDLGSEAITTWVHGESKEGIILEFYRAMVRNYMDWNLMLPYELEGESSLNSSFTNTFLKPGAMFPKVRIEANNARGKRIEAHFRQLRYGIEKKREGWIARPHAKDETNQAATDKVPQLPKQQIIQQGLADIAKWNNTLHGDQDLHPGMTRWDVFLDKQHPQLQPYNWPAILSGLGYTTETSMKAGRITLQGKHRVVGHHGTVATGDALINIMKQIEGEKVDVRWLDNNEGEVLKALVFDKSGRMVCELLGDLAYHRATLEQTPQCLINREITSAYAATVQGYISRGRKAINTIAIVENEQPAKSSRFVMPGIKPKYIIPTESAKPLPQILTDFEAESNSLRNSSKLSDRF